MHKSKSSIEMYGVLTFCISLILLFYLGLEYYISWSISIVLFLLTMIFEHRKKFGFVESNEINKNTSFNEIKCGVIFCAIQFSLFFILLYCFNPSVLLNIFEYIPLFFVLKSIFLFIDKKNGHGYDFFAKIGKAIIIKDTKSVFDYIKINSIKFFYLPLMFYIAGNLSFNVSGIIESRSVSQQWYYFLFNFLYLIDVSVAIIGYSHASPALNSQIRSTNPYVSGWIFALICYAPFNMFLALSTGLKAFSSPEWYNYIDINSSVGFLYGAIIISLTAIYVWGTLSFGLKFSNLTNRGIITHGPYKYFKHPSYISKNISWWLIYVPFMYGNDWVESTLMCLMCLSFNVIYFFRAITEEMHLKEDSDYINYINNK